MKKSDFIVETTKGFNEMNDDDILSAELIDLQKVFLMGYHEADSVPLLIFERISDAKMVSYWIYENLDDSVLSNGKANKSLLEKPIWIAIWNLKGKAYERIVVGQMMHSLDELAPIAIDDPPFSHILKNKFKAPDLKMH